ncbi:unnamed protein product (macronuclear) [Paramecium tetraurelia]|uniref:EGF-like domain-containing protein n=1 Tax=Paramecium tetraurelia TaxID=5888 RepID=A0BJX4_PARTE|nr:uncharacterized protein GSPATT00029471001 [Paramecium tetraurelia]CAK58841.1 unnamed protein product [Paramecium tetraurelia]|eukprot:XP_001426239.1 hypothetical protein (macronuclear) [Paramecium tetraurelia strain d4-2]
MIQPNFAIFLYLNCIIKVFGVMEVISSSFQGNTFSDADNWVVSGASPQFTDCMGTLLFVGYNAFGSRTTVSKIFTLPPHFKINLQLQFWKIDSWDNEIAQVYVDQQIGWQLAQFGTQGTDICGTVMDEYREMSFNLNLIVQHSGPTAIVVVTSVLNEGRDNESWGMRDFIISVERCPDGCQICKETDTDVQFGPNQVMMKYNPMVGIQFQQLLKLHIVDLLLYLVVITKQELVQLQVGLFLNIPQHARIKIQFLWVKIDSWDSEHAYMRLDGTLIWQKQFFFDQGQFWKICGDSHDDHRTLFTRIELDLNHTSTQFEISFTTNLNESPDGESFGIRDFVLLYSQCPQGNYNTGVAETGCQLCYKSCYQCNGPNIDDCIDCGDPNIYYKQLVSKQCTCLDRTIEITQNDGSTICQPCHPRCEKCSKPLDNTANQYCTMCIAGQNRDVNNQFICACRAGYGEDGISDACFKCHYTCENCNGPLATNCTACSSSSFRNLSSDYQCLCNNSYIDTGTNDMVCKCKLFNITILQTIVIILVLVVSYLQKINAQVVPFQGNQIEQEPHLNVAAKIQIIIVMANHQNVKHVISLAILVMAVWIVTVQLATQLIVNIQCSNVFVLMDIMILVYYNVPLAILHVVPVMVLLRINVQHSHPVQQKYFGNKHCSDNNREFKTNLCACLDTYMGKTVGDPMCYKCSYRCANCSGTIDNCTACPLYSYRDLGTNNSCSCPDKMYDPPNNPICIPCYVNCLTCNGSQQNQCTSCYTQIMRQLDPSGNCVCMSTYYDVGTPECQRINQNNAQHAVLIVWIVQMLLIIVYLVNQIDIYKGMFVFARPSQLELLSLVMKLQEKLIVKVLSNQFNIIDCHYSCLQCSGSKYNQCTSCMASDGRVFTNSTCVCGPNYFDIGKPKCLGCYYSCETCAGLDTTCLTCLSNSFRTLINSQCICQKGYFDDGSNPICQKCHYSCSECNTISTKCNVCPSASNRVFNGTLFTCNCIDSYFDNGTQTCQKCYYTCLTCNSFGSQFCQSCLDKTTSFRVYNQGACFCLPGYYDDGISTNCNKCLSSCLTCLNTADNCTSCESPRYLDGSACPCSVGYFVNNLSKCSKCNQNCLNCSLTSTTCIECDSSLMRVLDSATKTCICKPGATQINSLCQECDITCQACLNSITSCTSCKVLRQLSNNQCKCVDGTYESGSDKQCLFCDQTCLTCINQANYCTTCAVDKFRIFSTGNICICKDGYYEEPISLDCRPCDSSCLTCKVFPTNCLTCDPSYNLSLNTTGRCLCSSGYFFNSSTSTCAMCTVLCRECKSLSQCLECESITRYFDPVNLKCPCKDGYYEVNQKKCSCNNFRVTVVCNFSCKTCQSLPTNCLSCEPTNYRLLNSSNQCICLDGYYDIGIELCQPCNPICQTCVMTSTKCTSCNQAQNFRLLNLNQCVCQNGYYDSGQLVCQKCSNQCLTCKGRRDFCLSCDINQNRLDQSVINRCPCLTGFYQDINEQCQKCHYKCSTCNSQRDNCVTCFQSSTSNRLTISQNCICKDGYYDDGFQVDCFKCSARCRVCQNSSNNCLSCFGNLREAPPACSCKLGYFENSSLNCETCDNQCQTCDKTSSNCLTCKEGRSTQLCICEDGYFEGGQPLCEKCAFQCKTCQESSINCLSCKGDRIKFPLCQCPDGFYDDFSNESCQTCFWLCKTCNLDGCLTCKANRVLSPEMSCDQPPDSVSHLDTPWCSTCQVAVLDVRFSDDLLYISVKFDFTLNSQFFTTQFQDNVCLQILDDKTYKLLGKNPICEIDPIDDTILQIGVGQQPKILPGDQIFFQENYFGHQDCDQRLNIFIFNDVKSPLNPVSPIAIYDLPTYLINPCDDNNIALKSKLNDGLRGFIEIKWTYTVSGTNGKGDIENFVNSLTKFQMLELVIPIQTLPKQSNITFELEFQNFVAQKSVQQIKLETHSGQFPTILWVSKPTYYTFEAIVLEFKIKKKACSDLNKTQFDNSSYTLSIVEVHRNNSNSRSSRVNYSEITSGSSFNVTIPKYTLTPMIAYTFEQTTLDAVLNFSSNRNITIDISSGGILCQFNGTKKIQNYRKETQIFISCKDLDAQYDWNEDSNIDIDVQCLDLTMNSHCTDVNKKEIKVNHTDTFQTIPKQLIKPYTIQCWTVVAKKGLRTYKFKQNIVFLDNDFKILNVTYSKGYLMRPVNNYENLEFTINIPFQDRQYLVDYSLVIIYNFEVIKILQSEYFKQSFHIFDYYQEFTKGNTINLKFLAQFSNEIIPSQEDLVITVNLPPTCVVSLGSKIIQALKPQQIVTICEFSETAPFTYQLRYFLKKQDLTDYLSRTNDYSLIVSSYSSANNIEGYFPFSNGILLIQAMDSKGSYLNIQKQLNVTKTVINCSSINIVQYNLRYQISLLLEIVLNHYDQQNCVNLSKQLYQNIKTYLNAENSDDQLLVYQTTKLYKRAIQENNSSTTSMRLLTDNSENCFQNSTQTYYFRSTRPNATSNVTPFILQAELLQITTLTQSLITKLTDINDQISFNDVFLDEKLYQGKIAVLDSLIVVQLLIDDIFLKIPQATIKSNQDQEQIIIIAEGLINLIERISIYVNVQVQVNGLQLINNGEILKWQLSKITKEMLNKQFNIERDLLDGLIDFVQKEQIELSYNHLNLSQKLRTQLQTFYNQTLLEINENSYKKTNLKNHLYNNRYLDYQDAIKKYLIDMFQTPYCQEQVPDEKLYSFECVNINKEGNLTKCNLLIEEIDNKTVQVSCISEELGSIFLVQYPNNSALQLNATPNIDRGDGIDNRNLTLSEQPILLFYGIFIAFTLFIYFELISIESKSKQLPVQTRIESDISIDEVLKQTKSKTINFYPGNFAIFKLSFQFIHEVLSCFYTENHALTKSYRFLQLSIKISLFILFSFFQISLQDHIPLFVILFLNCGTFLLIRMTLKIFQAIYRFGGKWSLSIIIIYLATHFICYLEFILLMKRCQRDIQIINIEVSLCFIGSLLLFYVIVEPIMIFSRIYIFRRIAQSIRNQTIQPLNQLIYFFIQHQKLDELFHYYAQI